LNPPTRPAARRTASTSLDPPSASMTLLRGTDAQAAVWGFGFRVQGLGFRVLGFGSQVSGFGVSGFGFRVLGYGFRVSGFRFRVSGFGFRASGFGFRGLGFGFRDLSLGEVPSGRRVTAHGDMLWTYEIGNEQQHAENGAAAAPQACFKAPQAIWSVPCFGAAICVGCGRGAVCILSGPLLAA